jgi:2-phospho-L-lactate/phosphoenolpyruvate guanylyltransferase
MKLWLVVPVKPLDTGKSRLTPVLATSERAGLMRHLLRHVLANAVAANCCAEIMVVSRDPQVWAVAHLAGAGVIHEHGYDLNAALEQARAYVLDQGGDALLILPADLPLVTVADIQELHQLGGAQPGVVIAPSRDGGTGALLLRPPDVLPFAFGPNSFQRHYRAAVEHEQPCRVYRSPTLAFDVDLPADWDELQTQQAWLPNINEVQRQYGRRAS